MHGTTNHKLLEGCLDFEFREKFQNPNAFKMFVSLSKGRNISRDFGENYG
jgi:hypothetical protein